MVTDEVSSLKPVEGVLVVRPYKEPSSGAMVIADNIKERDQVGIVVAIGPDAIKYEGKTKMHLSSPAKLGDIIVHTPYYADAFTYFKDGQRYRFIRFDEVRCIIDL